MTFLIILMSVMNKFEFVYVLIDRVTDVGQKMVENDSRSVYFFRSGSGLFTGYSGATTHRPNNSSIEIDSAPTVSHHWW
jgi:hypothetical protein